MRRLAVDPATLARLVDEGITPSGTFQLVAPNAPRSDARAIVLARTREGLASEPRSNGTSG